MKKFRQSSCSCCGESTPTVDMIPCQGGEKVCPMCAVNEVGLDVWPCRECGRLVLSEELRQVGYEELCRVCNGGAAVRREYELTDPDQKSTTDPRTLRIG